MSARALGCRSGFACLAAEASPGSEAGVFDEHHDRAHAVGTSDVAAARTSAASRIAANRKTNTSRAKAASMSGCAQAEFILDTGTIAASCSGTADSIAPERRQMTRSSACSMR